MTHPISYPDPNQNPSGQPPRAKRRIWPWIVVGVPVLLFGACSVAVVSSVGGEKEATVTSGPAGDEVVADRGPEFSGKLDHDTAAVAGATITRDDLAYTVGPLQLIDSVLGSYLCSEVTIVNVGTDQNDFNGYMDWHVQDAGGAIRNSTFGADRPMLNSGRLAPGGAATGNVCFDARAGAAPGTYVVLFEDTFSLSTDRLAWVSTL
ncbi:MULTISPECIES: DUF4352 domain-containing protein [unclassified Rhodococcus (in: high G+C Gram-positive bacteria)]|uniref:DUF4352 domain-containing protein n=1 Tax=unclassified Rhodococcus (in: high G+C Gram-positive bacteria) TaxID=192944 RepID=UPI001469FBF2|nr:MULTISPECIES: DUF4352 domain-containing protein [unclassified Rhodococcus (in: high G+C Gram-positive bacteria)]NMD95136.1 DUF4352 domain-containing protein [Rhodococcus sp. BL-253-APC-6A1W]NME81236.1 DUF4352 domain-containing protein [Rhodococcus sp. 105337]